MCPGHPGGDRYRMSYHPRRVSRRCRCRRAHSSSLVRYRKRTRVGDVGEPNRAENAKCAAALRLELAVVDVRVVGKIHQGAILRDDRPAFVVDRRTADRERRPIDGLHDSVLKFSCVASPARSTVSAVAWSAMIKLLLVSSRLLAPMLPDPRIVWLPCGRVGSSKRPRRSGCGWHHP